MARMAATRGKLICPHNWQDGLVCVANAHLMAAVPNRFMLESNMTPNPFKEGLFKEKFAAVKGYIDVPNKPGLGVELKEGLAEAVPADSGQLEHARSRYAETVMRCPSQPPDGCTCRAKTCRDESLDTAGTSAQCHFVNTQQQLRSHRSGADSQSAASRLLGTRFRARPAGVPMSRDAAGTSACATKSTPPNVKSFLRGR